MVNMCEVRGPLTQPICGFPDCESLGNPVEDNYRCTIFLCPQHWWAKMFIFREKIEAVGENILVVIDKHSSRYWCSFYILPLEIVMWLQDTYDLHGIVYFDDKKYTNFRKFRRWSSLFAFIIKPSLPGLAPKFKWDNTRVQDIWYSGKRVVDVVHGKLRDVIYKLPHDKKSMWRDFFAKIFQSMDRYIADERELRQSAIEAVKKSLSEKERTYYRLRAEFVESERQLTLEIKGLKRMLRKLKL